jgi:hypothetical protein
MPRCENTLSSVNIEEDDGEREFAPAEEIVFRLDRVVDDLDTIARLVAAREGVPLGEDERRRMRALLDRASRDVDELFDIATTAAHTDSMGKN